MRRVLLLSLLAASAPAAAAQTLQAHVEVFQLTATLAVRDLDTAAAEKAFQAASGELVALGSLFDPAGSAAGGLADLNRAAGQGKHAIDPRLAAVLDRALHFCRWSNGAQGPLGGELERVWAKRYPAAEEVAPAGFDAALASAACDHLQLDLAGSYADLAAGSEISLGSYALGFAIDRAVDALVAHRVTNGFVAIGNVERAFGAGTDGKGWPITPPPVSGLAVTLPDLWLRDQAVALISRDDAAGGSPLARLYLDQRKGRAPQMSLAVVAATALAVDAQALASTLFAIGSHEGQMRLGSLQPRPAALWVVGTGEGLPLMVEYHFTALRRALGETGPRKNAS